MTILRIYRDSWRKAHESKRQDGDKTLYAKRRSRAAARGEGSFGPAVMALTMGLGRICGQIVIARLNEALLLRWGTVIAAGGLAIVGLAPSPAVAYLGLIVTGLGGLAVANLATGLFQGFPVSTSGSRTAVAEQSGAKSQLTGVVGALLITAMLLFVPGLFRNLPLCCSLEWVWLVSVSIADVNNFFL